MKRRRVHPSLLTPEEIADKKERAKKLFKAIYEADFSAETAYKLFVLGSDGERSNTNLSEQSQCSSIPIKGTKGTHKVNQMSNKTKTQQNDQHAKNEKLSKYLSYKLRHNPGNLQMDTEGWVNLNDLAREIDQGDLTKARLEIEEVVKTCPKQRFAIDRERDMIRANQGHSLAIVLNLAEQVPPKILFHGTSKRPMQSIGMEGLKKMQRHHVHLSTEFSTALDVGARRGNPVVIRIDALGMHRDGFKFYRANNGVWLTDHVPLKYMSWEQ